MSLLDFLSLFLSLNFHNSGCFRSENFHHYETDRNEHNSRKLFFLNICWLNDVSEYFCCFHHCNSKIKIKNKGMHKFNILNKITHKLVSTGCIMIRSASLQISKSNSKNPKELNWRSSGISCVKISWKLLESEKTRGGKLGPMPLIITSLWNEIYL